MSYLSELTAHERLTVDNARSTCLPLSKTDQT